MQVLVELRNDFPRLQTAGVGTQALHPARQHAHEAEILFDDGQHVGPQHFYRYIALLAVTALQRGKVNLRDRGTGHRLALEAAEDLTDRAAECAFDRGDRHIRAEGRHTVLQARKFVRDILRQEIAPGRKHLSELDEDRTQSLQRLAHALPTRRLQIASH